MDHRIVGMHILAVLIQDIHDSPSAACNTAKFRKAGKSGQQYDERARKAKVWV